MKSNAKRKLTEAEALSIVSNVDDGNFLSSLSELNWLARTELNPSTVAKMLEVAFLVGKRTAARKISGAAEATASEAFNTIEAMFKESARR